MRRTLFASLFGMGMALALGCRVEEKPMPPPNPNSQPQAQQPAEPAPLGIPAFDAGPDEYELGWFLPVFGRI